jgi:hypothetical protein
MASDLSSDLLKAAASGDKDRCQLLLSQGADVHGRDDKVSGHTCRLYADICKHLCSIQQFFDYLFKDIFIKYIISSNYSVNSPSSIYYCVTRTTTSEYECI